MKEPKIDKKEARRLKCEAREERLYGNPIARTLVKGNPQVRWAYECYKSERQMAWWGNIWKWIFLGVGLGSFIMDCIMAIQGIPQDFTNSSITVGMGLCWWNFQQIHQTRADMYYLDIIQYSDKESLKKAVDSLMGGKKNGTDEAKKVD